MNRNTMWKQRHEASPLLSVHYNNNNNVHVKTFYLDDIPENPEAQQSREVFKKYIGKQRHGTDLLISDMCVIFVELLQLLAVIQFLSLRWIWPEDYLTATNFVFLVNLDVWSFDKINFGAFRSVQGYYTPSIEMSFSYAHLLIGWGVFCSLLIIAYIIAYGVIGYMKHSYMFLQIAWLQRVAVIVVQLLTLPIGTAFMRTWQITSDSKVDINNELMAFSGTHLAIIIPLSLFLLFICISFPIWLIHKTSKQIIGKTTDRHEGYLQLKEMEHSVNLDMIWTVRGFHIFASYKLYLRHNRALFHVYKFIFLLFSTCLYNFMLAQTITLAVLLSIALLVVIVMAPYRVTCYNIVLALSLALITSDVIFSVVITSFNPATIQSSWLVPPYSVWILSILNASFIILWFVFIVYVLARQFCLTPVRSLSPLWPSMSNSGILRLTPKTRTYIRAILHGRQLLERTARMPVILAPAYELSQEIQRINAFCREAECSRDAIHDSLWDLLDELIEEHAYVMPKSLFAASVKGSVKKTAREFISLVPQLVHRLHQREYDLILVPPKRRRILFKLFVLATFLDARSRNVAKKSAEKEALKMLWQPTPNAVLYKENECRDLLYPSAQFGPLCRPAVTHLQDDHIDPIQMTDSEGDMSGMFDVWMKEVEHVPKTIEAKPAGAMIDTKHGCSNSGFLDEPDYVQYEFPEEIHSTNDGFTDTFDQSNDGLVDDTVVTEVDMENDPEACDIVTEIKSDELVADVLDVGDIGDSVV